MRLLIFILFVFFTVPAFAQDHDPATLSRKITAHLHTDKEKVTAIFKWITNNISYRIKSNPIYVIGPATSKFSKSDEDINDTGALKPLNERVAETVLRNKEAICEGYARLFTTLCDYAGIRSEIIPGYARSSFNKPIPKFGVNHYWNAVMIDGDWHLLDATWASGYVTYRKDEFIQEYDGKYFLTSPEVFIQDHYPDDIRWTLLPPGKMPREFNASPFLQKSFHKYSIASFHPATGIIEAAIGDTIRIELATTNSARDKFISPDMLVDSTIFSTSSSMIFLQPLNNDLKNQVAHNRHRYELPVTRNDIEWLYLMYNDDMVIRYKVNVK